MENQGICTEPNDEMKLVMQNLGKDPANQGNSRCKHKQAGILKKDPAFETSLHFFPLSIFHIVTSAQLLTPL